MAPHLGASNADLGSSSGSNNLSTQDSVREVGKTAMLLPATASNVLQDVGAGSEAQQPQAPEKKKKRSKMHACEVCGKKFPRYVTLCRHPEANSKKLLPGQVG